VDGDDRLDPLIEGCSIRCGGDDTVMPVGKQTTRIFILPRGTRAPSRLELHSNNASLTRALRSGSTWFIALQIMLTFEKFLPSESVKVFSARLIALSVNSENGPLLITFWKACGVSNKLAHTRARCNMSLNTYSGSPRC